MYTRYDSVHGVIQISQLANLITQHKIFQRLNSICQLGSLQFILPHANHTRYVHSIGTAYLARKFATALSEKYSSITPVEVLCVEIAGLCHDIGHGPFSHLFDKVLADTKCENSHHEMRSIILTKYIINEILSKNVPESSLLTKDYLELILYFIDTEKYSEIFGTDHLPSYTKGLEQIVNNAFTLVDVDKLDYIERDKRALRLDHLKATVNVNDLFEKCAIIDGNLVFNATCKETIDNVIHRRFMLYTEFYYSKDAKAADRMISDALQIASKKLHFLQCSSLKTIDQLEEFTMMTDLYIVEKILNSDLLDAKQIIMRVIEGNLYKLVASFTSEEDSGCKLLATFDLTTNKSSPSNLLPKIIYHNEDVILSHVPKYITYDKYDTRPHR
jgi:hypothetical protein